MPVLVGDGGNCPQTEVPSPRESKANVARAVEVAAKEKLGRVPEVHTGNVFAKSVLSGGDALQDENPIESGAI